MKTETKLDLTARILDLPESEVSAGSALHHAMRARGCDEIPGWHINALNCWNVTVAEFLDLCGPLQTPEAPTVRETAGRIADTLGKAMIALEAGEAALSEARAALGGAVKTKHTAEQIRVALDVIDGNLYPEIAKWGDEMASAIDLLHQRKSDILRACNSHDRLVEALRVMVSKGHAHPDLVEQARAAPARPV